MEYSHRAWTTLHLICKKSRFVNHRQFQSTLWNGHRAHNDFEYTGTYDAILSKGPQISKQNGTFQGQQGNGWTWNVGIFLARDYHFLSCSSLRFPTITCDQVYFLEYQNYHVYKLHETSTHNGTGCSKTYSDKSYYIVLFLLWITIQGL